VRCQLLASKFYGGGSGVEEENPIRALASTQIRTPAADETAGVWSFRIGCSISKLPLLRLFVKVFVVIGDVTVCVSETERVLPGSSARQCRMSGWREAALCDADQLEGSPPHRYAEAAGGRKAPRHEIASGDSTPAVPQASGAASGYGDLSTGAGPAK